MGGYPDHVPPADEFIVLDADASQQYAINAVIAGESLIVRGPPGTGKSQTIANLIASLVARDKKVLWTFADHKMSTLVTMAKFLDEAER